MDSHIVTARGALRLGIGLMATLAGLDKFLNLLADWPSYVSPVAAHLLPVAPQTFMYAVGVIEFVVGLTILFVRPSVGALVACIWLLLVAGNLALGGHVDIAVRDAVLAVASYALAELSAAAESSVAVTEGHNTGRSPHNTPDSGSGSETLTPPIMRSLYSRLRRASAAPPRQSRQR